VKQHFMRKGSLIDLCALCIKEGRTIYGPQVYRLFPFVGMKMFRTPLCPISSDSLEVSDNNLFCMTFGSKPRGMLKLLQRLGKHCSCHLQG
jgi:hypothetical protein